jgi:signal transduction histidine kinase
MKRLISLIILSALFFSVVMAQSKPATPAEAEAWAKKAIAYYKEVGKDKAFEEFNNTKGKFTKGDLYIIVYDLTGKCWAQGSNIKMVGKDLIELKDADGRSFIKERVDIAKAKGKGWQNYRWSNPTTKAIEDKTVYIEKVDGFIFACGAYGKK